MENVHNMSHKELVALAIDQQTHIDMLESENKCSECGGSGKSWKKTVCVCRGTGRKSKAVEVLQKENYELRDAARKLQDSIVETQQKKEGRARELKRLYGMIRDLSTWSIKRSAELHDVGHWNRAIASWCAEVLSDEWKYR